MKSHNDVQYEAFLIASNLDDIVPVRCQEANCENCFNINGGTPGAILYLSVLDTLFPDHGYDVQAHNYATSMISEYKHTPNIGIGLFGGTTLLAWCLQSISRDGSRYQGAIRELESRIASQANQQLTLLSSVGKPIPSEYYDVISGLSGVVLYSIRFQSAKLLKIRRQICTRFCELLTTSDIRAFGSMSFTSRQAPATREMPTDYGYAHGILGVLMSCILLDTSNISKEIFAVIKRLVDISNRSSNFILPYSSSDYIETSSNGRYAWCYGNVPFYFFSQILEPINPVIAESLLDTAIAPLKFSDSQARNSLDIIGLVDNSICHGRAGIVLGLQPYLSCKDKHPIRDRLLEEIDSSVADPIDGGFLEGDLGTWAVRLALECTDAVSRLPAFFPFVSPVLWRNR